MKFALFIDKANPEILRGVLDVGKITGALFCGCQASETIWAAGIYLPQEVVALQGKETGLGLTWRPQGLGTGQWAVGLS